MIINISVTPALNCVLYDPEIYIHNYINVLRFRFPVYKFNSLLCQVLAYFLRCIRKGKKKFLI